MMIGDDTFDFECLSIDDCNSRSEEIVRSFRQNLNIDAIPEFCVKSSKFGKFLNGSLVKFKSMIVESCGSEIYVAAKSKLNSMRSYKYRDVSFDQGSEFEDMYDDRQVFLVKSIEYKNKSGSMSAINEELVENDRDNLKRKCSEELESSEGASCNSVVQQQTHQHVNAGCAPSPEMLNYKSDCLLKLYGCGQQSNLPTSGDMVEVIGIFRLESSFEDVMEADEDSNEDVRSNKLSRPESLIEDALNIQDDSNDEFETSRYPSSSVIPRLHCLLWRQISALEQDSDAVLVDFSEFATEASWSPVDSYHDTRLAQLIENRLHAAIYHAPFASSQQAINSLRNQSIRYISSSCNIDTYSAEMILICCLSRVICRTDDETIGHLVLRLRVTSSEQAKDLHECLKRLFQSCEHVDLSMLPGSNYGFAPSLNQTTGRLIESPLQLRPHTILVVEEAKFASSQLDERVVSSLKAVQTIIMNQWLDVTYSGNRECCAKILTDLPVIITSVISNIEKSILFANSTQINACFPECIISIECKPYFDEAESLTDYGLLCMQAYISLAKSCSPVLNQETVDELSRHYASERQTSNVSKQDLSRWLTMVRLVAASYCDSSAGLRYWEMVLHLEGTCHRVIVN